MSFEVGQEPGGVPLVRIRGDLDIANLDALEEAVSPLLLERPPRLVVDVGGLRFADSSAIALWVRWAGAVAEFELRDPPPLLRRVIGMMGLQRKFGLGE